MKVSEEMRRFFIKNIPVKMILETGWMIREFVMVERFGKIENLDKEMKQEIFNDVKELFPEETKTSLFIDKCRAYYVIAQMLNQI